MKCWLIAAAIYMAAVVTAPLHAATIYVVNHGWHTGIVIRRGDIPPNMWPEHRQAPPGESLEVGWGEREFYQTPDPNAWQALSAALWPSRSVLHLAGFNGPVREQFPHSEIIAIPVDTAGMARLAQYVSSAYERDPAGKIIRLGHGLYGDSRFFAARGNFHLFKTCNVWTARALAAAGCPVGAGITAENVMASARMCATSQ